jgi:DNA mismatch repair protein MutL
MLACAVAARIQVLDEALADQIAAGEVVERPASVVKELLENAVDAGATRVQVEIEGGGCGRIRVVDDGSGMSVQDAALSVRRHATSKLRVLEDLQSIATLGFRGEALPSIASVSRFRLLTRERSAVGGVEVAIEGGGGAQVREAACAPGTVVEVRDLFFNVPARLKFLKSRPTESGHVAAVCTRAALAHPELALTLSSDGRITRRYLGAGSFLERAQAVFETETLVPIQAERDGVRIEAALGAPERARNGAVGLHLFVNGRPVRDPSLARAVAYAYGSVLPPGRYPVGALQLRLPPDQVDVNVHPQKLEVRFQDSRTVFDTLTRLLAKQLGTSAWSGPSHRGAGYWQERLHGSGAAAAPSAYGNPSEQLNTRASLAQGDPWGLGATEQASEVLTTAASLVSEATGFRPEPQPQQPLLERGFFGALRVLGQVRKMLLVCEGHDALYIIDQHAADERIRFDRLRRAYEARDVKTQQLLFPERVECTEIEAALVEGQRETLASVGLDCTMLGPSTVAVHSVPAVLSRAAPERLLRDVLGELERAGGRAFSAAVDRALATMACHGAIRAGDPLPIEQAQALLRSLDEVGDFAGHCPHGRPVVHAVGLDELERKLGR